MLHAPIIAEARDWSREAPLDLAVIVPTFNEAGNVALLLASLEVALRGIVWEAIFVDDDSPDGTADLVREFGRSNPRIRVLQRIGRRGLASAVLEGMLATSAPVLAVIDADMQHDESLLPRLFAAVRAGTHDIAVGSRYAEGGSTGEWDGSRLAGSQVATRLAGWVSRTPLRDPMSGFFVVSREAMMAALPRLSGTGFKILLDLVTSSPRPLRILELPYRFRTRCAGESKLDLMVGAEYLKLLLDKSVGRLVPVRLLMFLAVGGLGLAVHLAILGSLLGLAGFAVAQTLAVGTAMTFNFALNNVFTYRDRRLHGWRFVTGLLSFYAVCLVGATANVGVGAYVHGIDGSWWAAGLAGAVIGAVWNFAASSVVTWRK